MTRDPIEFEVAGELPPLKGEAKSLLSVGHGQAARVRALLAASHAAKQRDGLPALGTRRIGMGVTVRSPSGVIGDATNSLGGIGDTLQQRRRGIDLSHLGELAGGFLYEDDTQIREIHYREETGPAGYTVRFWAL
jgi:hypothetical protein